MKKQIWMVLSLVAMNSLHSYNDNPQENIINSPIDNQEGGRFVLGEVLIPVRDLHPVVAPASRGRSNSFTEDLALSLQSEADNRINSMS